MISVDLAIAERVRLFCLIPSRRSGVSGRIIWSQFVSVYFWVFLWMSSCALVSLEQSSWARTSVSQENVGCHSSDPHHICLGLKYVVYVDPVSANAFLNRQEAQNVVGELNSVWRQCNISFQIDQYLAVNPSKFGTSYRTASYPDLTEIRHAFGEDKTILVVTTSEWSRDGTLGKSGANAWTSMPGGPPYGTIIERPVGHNANLVAHELGHYLNLLHVRDTSDLMNPVIYNYSQTIHGSQCKTARAAALYFWSPMLR